MISFLSANAQTFKKIKGNKNYITKELKLDDYNKIQLYKAFNVTHKINPDSAGLVRVYAEENLFEIIGVSVEKETLVIKTNAMREPEFGQVNIITYSSSLNGAHSENGGNIFLESPIESSEIKLAIMGSGNIIAEKTTCGVLKASCNGACNVEVKTGNVGFGNYSITGNGTLEMQNIETTESKATITGGGKIKCNVKEKLKAMLTGSGTVFYKGNPEISSKTVGSGQVKSL